MSDLAPKAKAPGVMLVSDDFAPNSGNFTVPVPGVEPEPNIGAAFVVATPNFGEVAPDPNTGVADAPPNDPNVGADLSSDFPKLGLLLPAIEPNENGAAVGLGSSDFDAGAPKLKPELAAPPPPSSRVVHGVNSFA